MQFALDELDNTGKQEDAVPSSSASGCCTPAPEAVAVPPEADGQEPAEEEAPNVHIELSRRALAAVEQDPDVCSICLDEFTAEDPSNGTQCGHMYHLQCIMQWAQRSRECPMCFKALSMKDKSLNELLPFGEYRPPEETTPSHVLLGLEAWELDHLLARLAAHNSGSGARRSRAARHAARTARAAAAQQAGTADTTRLSGTGPSSGAGSSSTVAASANVCDAGASSPITMQRDATRSASSSAAYPASWPPANHTRQYSRESGAPSDEHDGQPNSPAIDLRTRWAAVSSRAKESLSKTTSELRSLWGRGSSRNPQASGA